MTSKPVIEQSNGPLQPRTQPGRLFPSPVPPPSSSSATSPRPPSGISAASTVNDKSRDDHFDGTVPTTARKSSHSISSSPQTLGSSKGSLSAENREVRRAIRTLPPWVQSVDEDEYAGPTSLLLPKSPATIRPALHNYMPTPKANAVPGRHYDHMREGTPVTISSPISQHASTWHQFAKASNYEQRPPSSRGEIVDDEWIKENLPDLEAPWEPIDKEKQEDESGFWLLSASRRKRRLVRIHQTIMNHPMIPLVVRLTVLLFSCLALGLAGTIFHRSDTQGCQNNSSTWLALVVDVVAIVYITYITYDEYTSKPLGLRSHAAKMSLIFLDLLFIVFDSANLSLAFQALTDERWACQDPREPLSNECPYNKDICTRQKALTATLLIALLAWLSTFAISTLRLINKVAR